MAMENPDIQKWMLKKLGTASKQKTGIIPIAFRGRLDRLAILPKWPYDWSFFGRSPFSDPCPTCGKNRWVWFLHDEKLFANQVKTHCARMATHLKKCVGKGELWSYRRSHWSCLKNGEKKVKRVPPFTPIWRNSTGRFSLDKLKDC